MKILYLYYNQYEAVKRLVRHGYPVQGIDTIFIDDGSKTPLKCDWADVYRIDKDIPWNMPQANNLGFSKIPNEVVLRMDMDHYFKVDDLKRVSALRVGEKEIIKFPRIYKGKKLKEGKNIYLARVNDIVAIGGYNEDFCGNYGFEDGELMHRMKKNGFTFRVEDIPCQVDENYTKGLDRDTTINFNKYRKIIEKGNL